MARSKCTDGSCVTFQTLAVVLMLAVITPALTLCAEADRTLYPRSLAELKAMLKLLAPRKGSEGSQQEEYLQRLKQYRYVCGVPFENLRWDDGYADLAQHASLICAKLNKLTHTPEQPSGMSNAEYEICKKGTGQSNLFMGVTRARACVDGWMDDSDPSNIDRVGHRRWCVNPGMLKSAFATSGNYAAMYAFDNSNPKVPDWDFVAYPTRGYMPLDLFAGHRAWSVSPNMEKYATPSQDAVKVAIHAADAKLAPTGSPLKLDYFHVETGGFGSGPAIIFRPEGFNSAIEGVYIVEISGLKTKKGQDSTIQYLVNFINLQKVPDGPEGTVVYTNFFNQRLASVQALTDKFEQVGSLLEISENEFLPLADRAIATAVKNKLTELLKDPVLRHEMEASERYMTLSKLEQKAGKIKNQRTQAAVAYREFSLAYKDTRAGKKAADDFERLKQELQ